MERVAGRECGACVVCCTVPPIDTETLQKEAGVPCHHCTGSACGIYQTRPQGCRDSFCGWWYFPELDDSWRPDRSGVLLLAEAMPAVAGRAPQTGVKFLLTDSDRPLAAAGVLEFMISLFRIGVPVLLSVPGPPGFHGVAAVVAANAGPGATVDPDALSRHLVDLARSLRKGPFERASLSGMRRTGQPWAAER